MRCFKLLLFVMTLSFCAVSCDKSGELSTPEPEVGELVKISIEATTFQSTKVGYDPNGDESEYAFSWIEGDAVSLLVPTVAGNDNQQFVASTSAASTMLTGYITTWDESETHTIYSVYPYNQDGYSFDAATESIYIDNSTQSIDLSETNLYDNTLLVAATDGAIVSGADSYSIPSLHFSQAMSIFEIVITDIPEGETVTSLGFTSDNAVFINSASVSLRDGSILSGSESLSSSITTKITNQSGTTAAISFAVLPVDLTDEPITMSIITESSSSSQSYTKTFESGLDFETNTILSSSEGEFSLVDDVTAPTESNEFTLASFNGTFVPENTDIWIITDADATTADFEGLQTALTSLDGSGREIYLEFPNINSFPNSALAISSDALFALAAPIATFTGDSAFSSSALVEAYLPSVKTVGYNTFDECDNLYVISLPEATSICDGAFDSCDNLPEVSLPEATSIGVDAFAFCYNLTKISLPKAISIGESAFSGCNNLETISLPSATSIGNMAFRSCDNLSDISLPKATSIGESAFYYCDNLYDISLPEATSIGDYAFYDCDNLSEVSLPEATSIGDYAFANCYNLSEISLPEATSIGSSAFNGCTNLSDVSLPKATSIDGFAFSDCTNLSDVSLPEATSIGSRAFNGCIRLNYASLPLVTSISSKAFYGCDALTSLELATSGDTTLSSLSYDIFKISDSQTQEENITLTIGAANASLIEGTTLTVGSYSYTFKKIIFAGGSDASGSATADNAIGTRW